MRPIDLQDNLSKAPLAGREQNIQQAASDQAQRSGAQELNREHALNQTRPTEAEEADGADNRVDDKSGGAGQQGQRQRRESNRSAAEETVERPSPSAFSREIDLTA